MRKPLAMWGTAAGGRHREPGVGAATEGVDDVQGRGFAACRPERVYTNTG